jgi:probable HAF family extracellular repeat protein
MRRLLWALAAPALLAFPWPASAGYVVTDLNMPFEVGSSGQLTGLNDAGQVVGWGPSGGSSTTGAFVFSGGTWSALTGPWNTPPANYDARANAINNAGQVVGMYYNPQVGAGAAYLSSGGTVTALSPAVGPISNAMAINNAGQVVGLAQTATDTHPFLYSGGQVTNLGTLGGTYGYATAINASGQVAGFSSLPGNATQHGFLYSGGKLQDLGALGGTWSNATGINASGQVVGYATTASGTYHAFLYSGGKMTDLGTLGGGLSTAYGINDVGQVVGSSLGADFTHAFLYSGGKMTDLNTLLPHGTSVTLLGALAINNHGQILALGTNIQGYLLTPVSDAPEPATLALLAVGGAGLLGAAWRHRGRK